MGDTVQEFGDERLILNTVAFGFVLDRFEILAIDADVQDCVLASMGDGLDNRIKL